jgi:hypothetical protein
MGPVARIGLSLLTQAMGYNRVVSALRATVVASVFLVLAAVALLAATGMACAALWAFLAPALGPAGASLAVAGALVVVALAFVFGAWLVGRRGTRTPPPKIGPEQLAALTVALEEAVGENKAASLLAAFMAGVAADQAMRRS